MVTIQELENRINQNWKAINDAYSGGADYWDVAWMQEQINEDLAQIQKIKSAQTADAQAKVEEQKKADEAAAAEAKRQADQQAFFTSVTNAQKATQKGNDMISTQFEQMDESQKQKDLQKTASIVSSQVSPAVGFDIGEASKSSVANTGAFPSSAKRPVKPGYQQQQQTQQTNQTSSGANQFMLPDMAGIKLGGL